MSGGNLELQASGKRIPIRIATGGVDWAAREIVSLLGAHGPRVFVIADQRVALLYGETMRKALHAAGYESTVATFPPGEQSKHLRTTERLLNELADGKFARDDLIVGLGGGVATDIAGFVAAIYQRGIPWVAVATSLMGMVDAAIGGKTGVDHPLGKNLIGAFHQPLAVFAPTQTLGSLPKREWNCGMAEFLKSALISGGDLWRLVQARNWDIRRWSAREQLRAIELSASIKIEIVAQDEKESGSRRTLNLGHTFGHALETVTGYAHYRHGEAVALGLRAAVRLSNVTGFMEDALAAEIDKLLSGAPAPRAEIDSNALLEALTRDKKVAHGRVHWVLLREPGKTVITDEVTAHLIRETAEWLRGIAREGHDIEPEVPRPTILILNGPNLNLLGTREPEIYGTETLDDLERSCIKCAEEAGALTICRQSNDEGGLVTLIQQARHWADGIIINPGGYTHTSVAIRDAISAVQIPTIEVHLSDISEREAFRQQSVIRDVCVGCVAGKGKAGYGEAIALLLEHLRGNPEAYKV